VALGAPSLEDSAAGSAAVVLALGFWA